MHTELLKEELLNYLKLSEEQKRSLKEENTILIAGAGSGKTTCLIARYVYDVIVRKIKPENILALTYTNKAANEMRIRLRETLRNIYLTDEKARKIRDVLKEEKEHESKVKTDLIGIEFAFITTFHSFAQSIIHSMPVEFRLCEPGFIDEIGEDIFLDDLIKKTFKKIASGHDKELFCAIEHLMERESLESLMSLIKNIIRSWHGKAMKGRMRDAFAKYLKDVEKFNMATMFDDLRSYFQKAYKEYETVKDTSTKTKNIGILSSILQIFDKSSNMHDVYEKYVGMGYPYLKAKIVKELTDEINHKIGIFELWKKFYHNEKIFLLADHINDIMEDKLEEKRIITYAKMLELFEQGLENEQFAAIMRKRFRSILIDEYQDSNRQQMNIIYRLSSQSSVNTEPEDGKLFIVGDPKQSIYGFRNADVSIFSKTMKHFEKMNYNVVKLRENYRSEKELIDYYNSNLRSIMPEMEQEYAIGYGPEMENKKKNKLNGEIGFYECMDKDQEVDITVKLILELITKGYRYSDIAVLLRSYSGKIGEFKQRFAEFGIPLFAGSEAKITEYVELNDMINYINALANPYDDIKFISALKGVFFLVDDITLYEISKSSGETFFERAEKTFENMPIYKEKLNVFKEIQRGINSETFTQTLHSIVNKNDLDPLIKNFTEYKYIQNGIEKLIEISNNIYVSNIFTFYDYANYLDKNRDNIKYESDYSENDNAVRILTVHKSKGLQYPIVIYPQLSSQIQGRDKIIIENEYIVIKYSKGEGRRQPQLVQLSIEKEIEEKKRLLYVTFTRAKEKLFVIYDKKGYCFDDLRSGYNRDIQLDLEGYHINISKVIPDEIPEKHITRRDGVKIMSVNRFLDIIYQNEYKGNSISTQEKVKIGIYIHRALAEGGLSQSVFDMQEDEEIIMKCSKMYEDFVSSDVYKELMKYERHFREITVSGIYRYDNEDYLLMGRLDHLIEDGYNAIIVDYKTSIAESMLDRDKMQLEIYASLLKKRYKSIKKYLIRISPPEIIKIGDGL